MKLVCAWCLQEGKPADMGDKEPLDDTRVSHTICDDHFKQFDAQYGDPHKT